MGEILIRKAEAALVFGTQFASAKEANSPGQTIMNVLTVLKPASENQQRSI